jgi:hypothetical protein
VNLGKNVTLRGTVIIVASNNDTIDIPPGSILENVFLLTTALMVGCGYWLLAYNGALELSTFDFVDYVPSLKVIVILAGLEYVCYFTFVCCDLTFLFRILSF